MTPRIPVAAVLVAIIIAVPIARELISSQRDYGLPVGVLLLSVAAAVSGVAVWQRVKGRNDNE